MPPRLLAGASGFSYASWKPGWYRADAKPAEFLRLYAERLPSVELNTTGYRLPGEEQFERWAALTPPDFRFAVKMTPRGFGAIATFEERVRLLGERLGPIRVVVTRPRDEGYLELFLGSIDPSLRYALDLRHSSWDGVEERLAEAGVARVDDVDAPVAFRYLRFRDPPYDEPALEAIAGRVRERLELGEDVYCYFRHEDEPTAPRYAERLLELVDVGESGRGP
jgi:uncharacterized protein YecE (DUF72 family)